MSTFVKKIFPFCALITVLLISSLNIDTSNNTATHHRSAFNKIELDNDDILSQSTHIIDAIYLGEYVTDSGTELMFKPVKEIKGTLDGDNQEIIYVRPFNDEYATISKKNSFDFTRNEKYMLFLEKYTSVYYEHDNFVQLGEIILSSEDSQWDEYHTLANKISETSRTSVPTEYGVAYSSLKGLTYIIS